MRGDRSSRDFIAMPTANRRRRRRSSGSNDGPSPATIAVPRQMPRSNSTSQLIGSIARSPTDVTNLPQLTAESPPLDQELALNLPILRPVEVYDFRPSEPARSTPLDLSVVAHNIAANPVLSQLSSRSEITKLLFVRSKPMLLIESLVLLICQEREPDPRRQLSLFNSVCSDLESSGFLGSSYKVDLLYQIRRMFSGHMHQLINRKMTEVARNTNVISTPQLTSQLQNLRINNDNSLGLTPECSSRYKRDFIQKELINQGGFGKVYRATYTYDMVDYAVKVISFTVTNQKDIAKVLKEVQLYASLPSHPNVVGYKTAWYEMEFNPFLEQIESTPKARITPVASNSKEPTRNVVENKGDDSSSGSSARSFTSTETSLHSSQKKIYSSSTVSEDVIFVQSDSANHISPSASSSAINTAHTSSRVQITELPDSPVTNDSYYTTVLRNRTESVTVAPDNADEEVPPNTNDDFAIDASSQNLNENVRATNGVNIFDFISPSEKIHRQGPLIKLYIQMELCRNENLKKWIKRRNKKFFSSSPENSQNTLPYDEYNTAIDMFKQIVTGVEFVHSKNLIHRDLKPQNILFDLQSGKILKIGDFGLATLNENDIHVCDLAHDEDGACEDGCSGPAISGDNRSQNHVVEALSRGNSFTGSKHTAGLGTTVYVAPEQKTTNNYDNKADMYSLGIILLELICPFNTDSEKAHTIECLKKKQVVPNALLSAYPSASGLILSLTSIKPSLRPSASQLLRSNDIFLSSEQQILHLKDQLQCAKNEIEHLNATIDELKRQLEARSGD